MHAGPVSLNGRNRGTPPCACICERRLRTLPELAAQDEERAKAIVRYLLQDRFVGTVDDKVQGLRVEALEPADSSVR